MKKLTATQQSVMDEAWKKLHNINSCRTGYEYFKKHKQGWRETEEMVRFATMEWEDGKQNIVDVSASHQTLRALEKAGCIRIVDIEWNKFEIL